MGARKPADNTVAGNPYLAAQLAAGCNRYAKMITEAPTNHNGEHLETLPALAAPEVLSSDSRVALAELFRQHARELLAPHRADIGG